MDKANGAIVMAKREQLFSRLKKVWLRSKLKHDQKTWSKVFEPGQNIFKLADGVGSSETKYNSINLSWHRTLEQKVRPKIIWNAASVGECVINMVLIEDC